MAKDALTIASDNPLAKLLQETPDVEATTSVPYLAFFSKKAESALDIQAECPSLQEGEPYVKTASGAFEVVTAWGLVGPTFHYWCAMNHEYDVTEVVTSDPGRQSRMKEHIAAPVIAYTDSGVHMTMTTFRPTKCKAVGDVLAGIKRATDDAVAAKGPIGKQLVKLPQSLRVVGMTDVIQRVGQNGQYQLARCRTRLLSDVEIQHLIDALADDAFAGITERVTESYDARVKHLQSKIKDGSA